MTSLIQKINILFENAELGYLTGIAVVVALALALLLLLIFLVKKIKRDVNPRKSTIFSHRKNKYKSRIGKNNSKYM